MKNIVYRLKVKISSRKWKWGLNDYSLEEAQKRQIEMQIVGIETKIVPISELLESYLIKEDKDMPDETAVTPVIEETTTPEVAATLPIEAPVETAIAPDNAEPSIETPTSTEEEISTLDKIIEDGKTLLHDVEDAFGIKHD